MQNFHDTFETCKQSLVSAFSICMTAPFSNFCRTLEIPLINCEINFIPTWSANCVIHGSTGTQIFAITLTKLYVPVVMQNY